MPGKVCMHLYTALFPNGYTIFLGVTKTKMDEEEIVWMFKEANSLNTIGEIVSIDKESPVEYAVTISTGESAKIYSTFVKEWFN